MEINSITTKPSPPAGTATHKLDCGCIQCKAKRYDALHDKWAISQLQLTHAQGELKAVKDLQDRTADELGGALTEADELRAALKLANASLENKTKENQSRVMDYIQERAEKNQEIDRLREALKQENRAGLVETVIVAIGAAFVAGLAAWLVGRFGR